MHHLFFSIGVCSMSEPFARVTGPSSTFIVTMVIVSIAASILTSISEHLIARFEESPERGLDWRIARFSVKARRIADSFLRLHRGGRDSGEEEDEEDD